MSKKLTINTSFDVYENPQALNKKDFELLTAAKKAIANAYAPYSGFNVGAAVLLENGIVITGNNQENAAYPSGLCAERVAVFYASSQYPDQKIIAIAVSAVSDNHILSVPIPPCGACRQALSEYEIKFETPIRLIMSGQSGEVLVSPSIANLLPLLFSAKDLGK